MKFSEFDAVIFDMDGVLIDSEPLWKIAMERVFNSIGCPLKKEDFQKTVGLRIDEVIQYWFEHIGWNEKSPQEVESEIVQSMIKLIMEHGKPLQGVVETLDYLNETGFKIGLATSSYSILIETVLTKLKIKEKFHFTHSAEHETFGKPHPAVYMTVANRLKVAPKKCLVVEDSLNGIIAGKAAGMKVVCIPEITHHTEPKLILADVQFENMQKMLTALR